MTTRQHTVIYPTYNRKTYTKRGCSQKYPVNTNKLSSSIFLDQTFSRLGIKALF